LVEVDWRSAPWIEVTAAACAEAARARVPSLEQDAGSA
jgi:hypothetical protein